MKADVWHPETVEAVDGLLMMTQYDVNWRQDLFHGWDFYDVSQSFEFRRAGYQVAVPYQQAPWVLHDCGFLNLAGYQTARDIWTGRFADAASFTGQHIKEHQDEEYFVLFYILFRIW